MLTHVSKFNYIVPVYFFLHYLFGDGEDIKCSYVDPDNSEKWYANYLALGHYDVNKKEDIYDFNEGEWPDWLINAGKPFKVTWD